MGVIEALSMPVVWLIALVIFALAEAATVSLVSIWFAAGALAALVVSLFTDNLFVQCAVFLAVSALCMALVRPLAQKRFSPLPHQPTRTLGNGEEQQGEEQSGNAFHAEHPTPIVLEAVDEVVTVVSQHDAKDDVELEERHKPAAPMGRRHFGDVERTCHA